MTIKFTRHTIPDIIELQPTRIGDARGWFVENFRKDVFDGLGLKLDFIQDNMSFSAQTGTLRGLHWQTPPFAQAKLVSCLRGSILDVAVDIRHGSPHFGQHVAVILSAEKGNHLLVPAGFAHGFCTLEPGCQVAYKVTAPYSLAHDRGCRWHDPDLAIKWPVTHENAILSAKDIGLPFFKDLPVDFSYCPSSEQVIS